MTLRNDIIGTPEGLRVWHQERAILETTDMICEIMKAEGVTRSELAARLGKTKGYITQLLDGTTNMTIRTVSDVFVSLGREFHPFQSRIVGNAPATAQEAFSVRKIIAATPYV